MKTLTDIERRVASAAEAALADRKYVSFVDVLCGVGWLERVHVDAWREGRVAHVEAELRVKPEKLEAARRAFAEWATARGLEPSEGWYVARSVGREALRFTASGDPELERAWRTHWLAGGLSAAQRARVEAKASAAPELVAVEPRNADWTCHRCGGTGAWLVMEPPGPACLGCLGFGELVWLPAGDAGVTRRARAASAKSLPVVRWSKTRQRYERIGLLVTPTALEVATQPR